jgi:acyl carrier protein
VSTKDRVIGIIRDCCALTEINITAKSNIKDISLDSLSFIQMIVNLETEFGIEFDDESLNIRDYTSVQDIITTVEGLQNAG